MGVIACLVVGVLLDRYHKFNLHLRIVCIGTPVIGIILTGVMSLNKFALSALLMAIAGVLMLPIIPVCISFASEVTFPMQAAMINGGVQLFGHLLGFILEVSAVAIL